MTQFDERERAYEAKFAHDADMQFRVGARSSRLVGEWAAELLGKSGDDARSYAMSIVSADCSGHGRDDVLRKLILDLIGKADEPRIRRKMAEMMAEAKEQILNEAG